MRLISIAITFLLLGQHFVSTQRTILDEIFKDFYRPMRQLGLVYFGRSGDEPKNLQLVHKAGKTQHSSPKAELKMCDTRQGPGRRSDVRPTSVHRLRPGDIDIIGAMGDSLTAGNGIFATKIFHVFVENRGVAWSNGGQYNWREYLTLPNILKEFNPNLYGYSTRDGLSTDRSSRFNVAEAGAYSRDMPYMATILKKRMQRDPRVNMTHDWKMVTMLIGNNDFCSDVCYYENPEESIKLHEQNMLKTYRYFRDNVPRLILNVVPPPNLRALTKMIGLPEICETILKLDCPCLWRRSKSQVDRMENIMKRWIALDKEICNREEFNTDTFTINMQTFTSFSEFPVNSKGESDLRYMSKDCFHLSQKGHAVASNAIWNNMLEKPEEKSVFNPIIYEKFLCPTKERPYIMTRENSRKDFVV